MPKKINQSTKTKAAKNQPKHKGLRKMKTLKQKPQKIEYSLKYKDKGNKKKSKNKGLTKLISRHCIIEKINYHPFSPPENCGQMILVFV